MQKFIGVALALSFLAACGQQDATEQAAAYDFSKDAYIWLEDVEGEKALAWVEEQNAVSLGHLEALPVFAPLKERNLEIYNSDERIATPAMRGDHVYNFWRDQDNIRGRWRRMLLDDYIEGSEDWELLLDVDKLAEGEDEDWVFKGVECLRPAYRRCLLNLSRGGADAVVVREFDVETKTFVMDGFSIPEAKQRVSWIDENAVWVGSDFGDGSLTDSGYPRTARLWKRGEPLEEATEIFAGEQADVAAGVYRTWDRDDSYDVAYRVPSFFETLNYLYTGDGEFRHIDIPADADFLVTGMDDRNRPKTDRKAIVLTSPHVAEPVHFRYAWGRNPQGNLQSADHSDLPFATQRSDDWKMEEVPDKYYANPTAAPRQSRRHRRSFAQKDLRLDDTERRLKEAQAFIDENQEKYERERAAFEEEKARQKARFENERA